MQKFHLFLFLILIFGCSQNQKYDQIAEFEKVLGERQTHAINLLVTDFENNLEKLYPDLSIEKGYEKYLTDIISDSTTDWEKFKFQSNQTNMEFNESGLWNEIYTKDSVSGLQINGVGKYMQAIYAVKDSDSLINKYWQKREAAGMMQMELIVPGILSQRPDFNDYFHKRIVVLEFSF